LTPVRGGALALGPFARHVSDVVFAIRFRAVSGNPRQSSKFGMASSSNSATVSSDEMEHRKVIRADRASGNEAARSQ
jgi:hypothetical protein